MKATEIKKGNTYVNKPENKKGKPSAWYQEREVIDEGEHCKPLSDGKVKDCIRYRVTAATSQGSVGHEANITRAAFAAWAVNEVCTGN